MADFADVASTLSEQDLDHALPTLNTLTKSATMNVMTAVQKFQSVVAL